MTTDTTPQVSGEAGGQEMPTPEFSDQATSSPSVDADAIVSKLTPLLEQLVERKVQSTKDKRLSKIEKALGGNLDLLAELEERGVTIPKEVRDEFRFRELENRISQPPAQPAPRSDNGLSEPKAAATDAIAELTKYELDPNDAEFLGLLKGKYQNRDAFDAAVQKHIVKKLAPPKAPNPADVVQSPATSATPVNVEAKVARLQELMKFPSKNKPEIDALRKDLGWT